MNTTMDVRDKTYRHLIDESNQFNTVRRKKTTQAMICILDQTPREDMLYNA